MDVSGGSAVKASKCIPHEEHDIAIIQLDAEIPDTEPVSIAKEKPDGYCDVLGVAGEKVKVAACAGGGAEAGPGAGAGGDAGGGADAAAPGWRKKRTTKCSREGIELLCGTGTAKNCEVKKWMTKRFKAVRFIRHFFSPNISSAGFPGGHRLGLRRSIGWRSVYALCW